MNDSSPGSLRFLERRWLLVLVIALAAALVAAFASLAQSTSYRSTAKLLVGAPASATVSPSNEDPVRALDTIVKLAKTHDVLAVAARRAQTTIGAMSSAVSISGDPNADILTVSGSAPTARSARGYADALATGLVTWEQRRNGELLRARVASLENQLAQFRGRATPSVTAAAADLRTQLVEARADLSANKSDITIVGPATLPTAPYAPRPLRNGLLGLLAGLIVGLAAAALRTRLDTRVRGVDDLAAALGARLLGPELEGHGLHGRRAHADFGGSDLLADRLRAIRTNIMLGLPEHKSGGHVVTVASATDHDGRSAVTANLAQAFASGGYRVLAVSADPRAPQLHRHFEPVLDSADDDNPLASAAPGGLFDVLDGDVDLDDAVRLSRLTGSSDDATVSLLANGRTSVDPARLLQSLAFVQLLAAARKSFDVVLLDAPPLLGRGDASLVAIRGDAVVAVARSDSLSRDEASQVRGALDAARVAVAGLVVTGSRYAREGLLRLGTGREAASGRVGRTAGHRKAAAGVVRRNVVARLKS